MPDVLIEARGLGIVRGGRMILEDVDLAVASGEVVTVIGPNGGGKTTLLKALMGLEAPTTGSVAARPGLRLGYVPQRFAPDPALPLTVRRFLALAPGADAAAVTRALEGAGAAHLAHRPFAALSGGETQRALLARALLRAPDLLVLDEPTQGVDIGGEEEFYVLLATLRDRLGCGVLMVSHHIHVVMAATDRVVCLNRHVCCTGRPGEIHDDDAYRRLFGIQPRPPLGLYAHHHDHRHAADGSVLDHRHADGEEAGS